MVGLSGLFSGSTVLYSQAKNDKLAMASAVKVMNELNLFIIKCFRNLWGQRYKVFWK